MNLVEEMTLLRVKSLFVFQLIKLKILLKNNLKIEKDKKLEKKKNQILVKNQIQQSIQNKLEENQTCQIIII